MKTSVRKWLFTALKLAVIAGSITYIAYKVDWQDHAVLKSTDAKVRAFGMVERDGEQLVEVEVDRVRVALPQSEFTRPKTKIEGQVMPVIVPGLQGVVRKVDSFFLICATLTFMPTYLILAWRLRLLLATQQVFLKARDAFKVTYASSFMNFAVPTGATGGDLYKAYYVSAHATGRRTEAVTVVLLDRAIGLVNFIFMASVVCLLGWRQGTVGTLGGTVAGMFSIAFVGGCCYFSQRIRGLLRIEERLAQLARWNRIGEIIQRIDRTAHSLRFHKKSLAAAFGWTFVNQTYVCVCVIFLARAAGMKCDATFDDLLAYFLAVIVGLMISGLPGNPPQGFGVLEGIMAHVLEGRYGTFAQIFAVCMGLRLLHLFWALPGAVVLLIEPRPKAQDLVRAEAALTGDDSDVTDALSLPPTEDLS